MKWIISNHKDCVVNENYQKEINGILKPKINLIICPNDSQLAEFKETSYPIGSQDVNYTFNTEELKNMKIQYTIVGHSDKRKKYHETNYEINIKMKELLEFGIYPILCVGEETEEEIDIKKVIAKELEECLKNIKTDNIIIAYEPIWAIGSGKIPDKEKLVDIIEYIKQKTRELIGIQPIVVYGGSVNENTISLLEEVKILDGYLIGSASIDINKLKRLIEVVE